jgi:hypothetical protein
MGSLGVLRRLLSAATFGGKTKASSAPIPSVRVQGDLSDDPWANDPPAPSADNMDAMSRLGDKSR